MRHAFSCTLLLLSCSWVAAGSGTTTKYEDRQPNATSNLKLADAQPGVDAARAAAITLALQRMAPTAKIDSIRPSGMPGVMEVVVAGSVVYASADGKFLLQGRLLDTTTRNDLTENTEKALRAKALQAIGPEKRLSFAAENPKHHVTIFTDVDCGYCRKLHQEIASYNQAGISVDYLFFPRAGLNSPSFDKAAFIWCADDRKQAMNQSMSAQGIAHSAATCNTPVSETLALAQRIAKAGTPTILAEDGSFLGGYQSAQELTSRLVAQNVRAAP